MTISCPTCHRKLDSSARVCPSCQHDFVADRRNKAIATGILLLVVIAIVSLIGLVLLFPGILINTLRGRYRNRTRGLLSSALRDWQTWVISLPFAVPVIIVFAQFWSQVSADMAAKEQKLANIVKQSETETHEIAHFPLLVDRWDPAHALQMDITDVSIKFQYPPGDNMSPNDPPPLVFFRDLPPFSPSHTTSSGGDPLIDFEHWYARFASASKRDSAIRVLTQALQSWQQRFPEAVKPSPYTQTSSPSVVETQVQRAEPVTESVQPSDSLPPQDNNNISQTAYSVAGITKGDTLNVHSGPAADTVITGRLPGGYASIYLVGAPVMNGTTEWVHISFANQTGWVNKQYLAGGTPKSQPVELVIPMTKTIVHRSQGRDTSKIASKPH